VLRQARHRRLHRRLDHQTFEDRAAEALAAVAFLHQQPQIDPARIGLWGVSQGGWIGPLAATRSGDVAFVVAVSGPGIGVAEQYAYMVEHMLRLDGFPQSQIEQALATAGRHMALLRRGAIDELIADQRAIAHEPWFAHFGGEDSEAELRFMRGILDYDPVPVLERVRCPLLGIWGAGDVLVPAQRSAALFAAALAKAGNDQFRLELFPGADHRIAVIERATGHEQMEWSPARRFAPGYLETMTGWLHQSVFHTATPNEGLAG
jgi:dienelactone hydrolase